MWTIIGIPIFFILIIFLEINIPALIAKNHEGLAEDSFSMLDHRATIVVLVVLSIFSWYVYLITILLILGLNIFGGREFSSDFIESLQRFRDEKYINDIRVRLNIFKFRKIRKMLKSTDPEVKTVGVEYLYDFMKWDKKEVI